MQYLSPPWSTESKEFRECGLQASSCPNGVHWQGGLFRPIEFSRTRTPRTKVHMIAVPCGQECKDDRTRQKLPSQQHATTLVSSLPPHRTEPDLTCWSSRCEAPSSLSSPNPPITLVQAECRILGHTASKEPYCTRVYAAVFRILRR